jgi:pimeloyl-ACP methyl ester carboxylesterase
MHYTHRAVRSVVLPDRIRLQYAEQGDPSGPALIFLHGYTDSWRSFEGVLRYLPRSFRAFALSQRGHGDSDRPEAAYGVDDFAADIAAFMDVLALDRAVIVGHCMGSQIARRFAIDYPERTLGLGLIASYADLRNNAAVQELWRSDISVLADPIDPAFVLAFQQSTLAQPTPQAFLDAVVAESLKLPAAVWRAVLLGLLQEDLPGDLGRIAVPTVIMWGDRDCICSRADQEILASRIASAELKVYPGGGHALHWEQPELVAADFAAFVRSRVLANGAVRLAG